MCTELLKIQRQTVCHLDEGEEELQEADRKSGCVDIGKKMH